ncbi:MAG: EAL domain-containing protein [Nitrosomonadales bacterium]|nr:EAL domain-containing protein [Nitrosomonadales bacterium]
MARDEILPVLYDFAVTIGSETSLGPLLTRTLQRLLFYTSFPAGFVSLDVPPCDGTGGEVPVTIDAAVGDYELIELVGKRIPLRQDLLCGTGVRETEKPELLASLANLHSDYRAYFRLPIEKLGVIVLLAPKIPASALPLTEMFMPMMSLLGKAVMLCRANDERTNGLLAERNLLAGVFELSSSGVMLTDAEANLLEVNKAFTRITGYSADEVRGKNPRILQSGRHDDSFYRDIWANLAAHQKWTGEIWNRRKDGEVYPQWLSIDVVCDRSGKPVNYIGIFVDISDRKEAEAQIHQLAFYDSLTGLPNRRLLLERMRQSLSVSARNGKHGAVLFLDLDNFKTLNDTRGHAVGDLLLAEVAARLCMCVRDGDTVARLGGDEFVVVIESLSTDADEAATQAELVAEKIHASLIRPAQLNEDVYETTPSIGIVLFLGHQEDIDGLLKRADTAMYQAKNAGRNAIRFFDPAMQAAIEERATLEADLKRALEQQQFRLHYQIQVDCSRQPQGAEVLLRWEHPQRGLLMPADFVPLAEENGMIVQIGQWVLDAACAQLRAWHADPRLRDLQLAVNVSPRQFHQPDFVWQVQETLERHGVNPLLLKLELTESMVLENVEDNIAKMVALKEVGVRFSLDDFGTGYSSLSYLKRLPLDQIKIDQSFVRDIASDQGDKVMVLIIVDMGMNFEVDVIAEGVETEEQFNLLMRYGCCSFQGYLFGEPVPLRDFEACLDDGSPVAKTGPVL